VDLFDYELPGDRIAQQPRPRGSSRLLLLDRETGEIRHHLFADLPELLRPGDLLVRNDVRVRYARLYGRDERDRVVEIFLLRTRGGTSTLWQTLAKPGRRAKAGRPIRFAEGIVGVVEDVEDAGTRTIRFDRPIDEILLERIGHVPLPPYIRRPAGAPDRPQDREAYQTVFARAPLAVAAPTAGLHFTPELVARLDPATVTLHVGLDTFRPVSADDLDDHEIHSERYRVEGRAWERIRAAERVAAVGTTTVRVLESLARGAPLEGRTSLFVTPGFEFRRADALVTNFHLPRSTLLALVMAFAGVERTRRLYREAVAERYRFYSFGDAMLLL
jgi:S-adenosylmethionine:tRNA ribosyltransferase-isomerase